MFNLKDDLTKKMESFVSKEYVAEAAENENIRYFGCMDCSNSCAENCARKCKKNTR